MTFFPKKSPLKKMRSSNSRGPSLERLSVCIRAELCRAQFREQTRIVNGNHTETEMTSCHSNKIEKKRLFSLLMKQTKKKKVDLTYER